MVEACDIYKNYLDIVEQPNGEWEPSPVGEGDWEHSPGDTYIIREVYSIYHKLPRQTTEFLYINK